MALEWIATGPHFTSISCTVRCRNGGEPPRNQRLLHRVSGHTRVDDLTSGEWTIRTPQRWWSGGRRPNEVLTGQETSHRFHVEIEFIIQPTEFIHWVSPVSATGQTTIGGRSGISLGAHWIGLNDVGQPMGMVVEESGLVLTAHVPSSPPYPDPWMDFSVDDVVIDPNLDDALFRWAGDPRVTPQDVDAEPSVALVGLATAASRLPFPLFVPRESPDTAVVHAAEHWLGPRAELTIQDPLTHRSYIIGEGAPLTGTRTGDWDPIDQHSTIRCRRQDALEVSRPRGAETLGMAGGDPYP